MRGRYIITYKVKIYFRNFVYVTYNYEIRVEIELFTLIKRLKKPKSVINHYLRIPNYFSA